MSPMTDHTKFGALALIRSSFERNNGIEKEAEILDARSSMYKTAMHKRYGSDKISTGSSGFSSISKNTQLGAYDMFAKVNSKYGRVQEPVKMENMLSREEQKTHLSLDPPAAKIQAQKALE